MKQVSSLYSLKFGSLGLLYRGLSWRDLITWGLLILAIASLWQYSCYILSPGQENLRLQYQWHWQRVGQFFVFRQADGVLRLGSLLIGLFSTLKLAIYSIFIGLSIGIPAGILQVQKLRLLRLLGQSYVAFIRNIPPLVVVTVFYFFLASPLVDWLGLESLSRNASPSLSSLLGLFFDMGQGQNNLVLGNFFAAVVILGIYEGSYIAEIIRAGIEEIPSGQYRAGLSLGLSPVQNYRLVILPQTFRAQLPALTNQFVSAIKDSAIVSLISIQELTFRSKQVITTTFAVVETSIVLFLLYLLLTGFCAYIASRLMRHYQFH